MKTEILDSILETKHAMHLQREARRDNIFFTFRRFDGVMYYCVVKTWYRNPDSALKHIQMLQANIAPSTEVRS